jgi:hypothetical protein
MALGTFLVIYAILALVTYLFIPIEQLTTPGMPTPTITIPRWQLGLANAGIILVIYGLVGLAGNWFAHQLKIPQTYREDAGWKDWFIWPMLLGLGIGVIFVIADRIFVAAGLGEGFPHPAFPFSMIASATAGIGEEILFRSFVMGLWATLLNLLLRRWTTTQVALWAGNIIAALAFSASHIPGIMVILGVTNPAEIPTLIIVEIFLLNSIVSLVAGERYMRNGLVAAIGIHFWTDIIWHVIWPLIGRVF